MEDLEYHEYADIVPRMNDSEFEELKMDIEQNGLIEDIILLDGKILDGRHRYEACQELEKEARFVDFNKLDIEMSPLNYVISENIKRRHLTSSQKAAIAVEADDIREKLKREAGKRKKEAGEEHGRGQEKVTQKIEKPNDKNERSTDHKLAKTFDTNRQYVSDAKKIKEEDPETHEKIKEGEETISEYKRKKRKKKREQKIKEEDKKATEGSNYKPKIANVTYEKFLDEISDRSQDLLITDPPYMTDIENVEEFAGDWIEKSLPKVKDSGQIYICTGAYPKELEVYLNILNHQNRFSLTNILVWTYRNTLGPQPKNKYHLNWQAIFYLRGPDAPSLQTEKMKDKFAVQDINAPDGRQGDRFHKWQKPNELAEKLIKNSIQQNYKVFDPFAGTGTFLIAASKYGADPVGCDNDNEILEIAKERGCIIK